MKQPVVITEETEVIKQIKNITRADANIVAVIVVGKNPDGYIISQTESKHMTAQERIEMLERLIRTIKGEESKQLPAPENVYKEGLGMNFFKRRITSIIKK